MGLFDPPKPVKPPSYGSKPSSFTDWMENELCGDGTALKLEIAVVLVPKGPEWAHEDSHYAERSLVKQRFKDLLRKTPLLALLPNVEQFCAKVAETANKELKEAQVRSIVVERLGLYAASPVRYINTGGSGGGGDGMATGMLLGGAMGMGLGMVLGDN